ncbi:MAG: hypothetical protein WBV94_08255 [Blastocatellia bacterium]
MRLYFNPAVSVYSFDSGSKEPAVLCKVLSNNNVVKQYVLPLALLDLLKQFDGDKEVTEVITDYREAHPDGHSAKSIENLVNSFLIPKGLLIDPSTDAPARMEPDNRKSFLYIKLPLISPQAVEPVARAMRWLFIRPVLISLLTLFIAGHFVFYTTVARNFPFDLNSIKGHEILVIFALSTLAALIHELGHASALLFYKCKGAEIGWGLYLIYPVLYTDVSEAWRLKRTQRAMIDIAGMYFQCIPLAVLVLIFLYTQSQFLLCAIIIVDLEIASALNPFLRTDGYWLVTDLFGIHNLRQQSLDLIKRVGLKIFPSKNKIAPPVWNLDRNTTIVLGSYLLLSAVFSLYLMKIILYQVVYHLLPNYPSTLLAFWSTLHEQPFNLLHAASALLDVLWRGLAVFGFLLFVYRIGAAIWKGLRSLSRHFMEGNKAKVAVEDLT